MDLVPVRYLSDDFRMLITYIKNRYPKTQYEVYDTEKDSFVKSIKDMIHAIDIPDYKQVETIFQGAVGSRDMFKFVFRIPFDYVPLFINSKDKDILELYFPWRMKIGK